MEFSPSDKLPVFSSDGGTDIDHILIIGDIGSPDAMGNIMSRILVVDDEESMREVVSRMLIRRGYDVVCAVNGRDALEKVSEFAPNLVITDLIMPDMEGLETINTLRRNYPHIPVIATSGGGRCGPHDYLNLAAKFGAVKVLPKPFTGEELFQAVIEAFSLQITPPQPPIVSTSSRL